MSNDDPEDEIRLMDDDIQSQDILLVGRCWSLRHRMHVGSVAFRTFIASRIPHYLAAKHSRSDTMRVVALCANSIAESGSRILKMVVVKKQRPTAAGAPTRKRDAGYYWKEVDKRQWRTLLGETMRDRIKATKRSKSGSLPQPAMSRTTKTRSFAETLKETMDNFHRGKSLDRKKVSVRKMHAVNPVQEAERGEGTARRLALNGESHCNQSALDTNAHIANQPAESSGTGSKRSMQADDDSSTSSGSVATKRLKIEYQKEEEADEDELGSVVEADVSFLVHDDDVRPHDILLGSTPEARKHAGSRAFRAFAQSKTKVYIEAKEKDLGRTVVVALATESLFQGGARMLRKSDDIDEDYWVSVDKQSWFLNMGHAIRYHVGQFRKNITKKNLRHPPKYVTEISSFAKALQDEIAVQETKAKSVCDAAAKQALIEFKDQEDQEDQYVVVPISKASGRKHKTATTEDVEGDEVSIHEKAARNDNYDDSSPPASAYSSDARRPASEMNIFIAAENAAPQQAAGSQFDVSPEDILREHYQLMRLVSGRTQTLRHPSLQSVLPSSPASDLEKSILPALASALGNAQQPRERILDSALPFYNNLPVALLGVEQGATSSLASLLTRHHEALLRSQALKEQAQRQNDIALAAYCQLVVRPCDSEEKKTAILNAVERNIHAVRCQARATPGR